MSEQQRPSKVIYFGTYITSHLNVIESQNFYSVLHRPLTYSNPAVPIIHSSLHDIVRSERVILRRDLNHKVISKNRDLLHDILADLGYLGEEEEGEDSGYGSEGSSSHAATGS